MGMQWNDARIDPDVRQGYNTLLKKNDQDTIRLTGEYRNFRGKELNWKELSVRMLTTIEELDILRH